MPDHVLSVLPLFSLLILRQHMGILFSHFSDEETGPEALSNLPEVTQLACWEVAEQEFQLKLLSCLQVLSPTAAHPLPPHPKLSSCSIQMGFLGM